MTKQREALELARKYIERECEHVDYGYMRTDNPNDFCPDPDSCTDDEIAAHKAACDAYDKGEYDPSGTAHSETQVDANGEVVRHILRAPWGLGTYRWRDPEGEDAIAAIDAALAQPDPQPVGWFMSPHGEFRANQAAVMERPPSSLRWSIPVYLSADAAPVAPARELSDDARDAARWRAIEVLWANYCETRLTQEEDGRWGIRCKEGVEVSDQVFLSDDYEETIDKARAALAASKEQAK